MTDRDFRSEMEKRLATSVSGLTDRELLIWLLSYVTPLEKAKEKAEHLFARFDNLQTVLGIPMGTLRKEGLSDKESALLSVLLPLIRKEEQEGIDRMVFDKADKTGAFFRRLFTGQRNENIYMLALDGDNRVLRLFHLTEGAVNSASFQNRRACELALGVGARRVIIAHNHPSGEATPSQADIVMTVQLLNAMELLGIEMWEHFVVTDEAYTPMILTTPTIYQRAPDSYYSEEMLSEARRIRRLL